MGMKINHRAIISFFILATLAQSPCLSEQRILTTTIIITVDRNKDGEMDGREIWTKSGKLLAKEYIENKGYSERCEIYDPRKGCLKAVITKYNGL